MQNVIANGEWQIANLFKIQILDFPFRHQTSSLRPLISEKHLVSPTKM